MAETSLHRFVERALRAGASREATIRVLEEAGWSREQIRDALSQWAEIPFVVPVPRPRPQRSARETFVYLVTFGALFLTAGHLAALHFAFVDLALADPLASWHDALRSRIRWSISVLAVAYPVFLVLSLRTARAVAREPARRGSAIRRWLTFLTLTLTSFVLVGDLVGILNALLAGGLTLGFALKAMIVALIAGGVFGHYLRLARADDRALER